jgi:general secretion pathway protein I
MRCCRHERGFTLLEVLIALMVISISLVAIAGEMISMLNAANTMRERTYASWIAHNKITEMRLANVVPEVSTSSGELDYANTEWAWRAVISETGVDNLFRVDVSISYPGGDPIMRPTTGFIGEPVPPGQSNRSWNRSAESTESPGVRE